MAAIGASVHLGIDATCWTNWRGFGRYARSLCRALVALRGHHRVTLVVDGSGPAHEPQLEADWLVVPTTRGLDEALHQRRSVRDLWRMSWAASRQSFDVFFFPSIDSFFPVFGPSLVATIHDTIPEAYPEWNPLPAVSRWLRRLKMWWALRACSRLLTGSRREAQRIQRYLRVPEQRISLVPYGVDSLFHDPASERSREPVIVHVGGPGPHKNESRLFQAFCACSNPEAQLLLIGRWPADLIPSHPRIQALGYCDDAALKQLYRKARAVVVPSLEEGCGLPALEAVACGTPAVVTRNSPLPELLGEAAVVVDPESTEQLTEAFDRALSPDFPPARAAQKGHGHTWETSARAAWKAFEGLQP